jgi:hypothetical protein
MKQSFEKLPRRWEQIIVALLNQGSTAEASRVTGISETSIWRALQDDAFQALYRNARRQIVENAISHLQSATVDAVRTLRLIAVDSESPSSARVSAARSIIEYSIRTVENLDLEARIVDLEEQLLNSKGVNK